LNHTKRSPEFLMKIRRLREKVVAGTLDAEERAEVAHILEFNTSDSGCMVKAAEDEPIFVLRAKDPLAPLSVQDWVFRAKFTGLHDSGKIGGSGRTSRSDGNRVIRITAKFPSTCRKCNGPIRKGETINYDPATKGTSHIECASAEREDEKPGPKADELADQLGFRSDNEQKGLFE
jgi:hypothetical protein